MKRFLLVIYFVVGATWGMNAQNWRFELGDTWYNWVFTDYENHLELGDRVDLKIYGVDLSKAVFIKNDKDQKLTKSIEGKIIIFDFWDTWCTTCMQKFPEMERLQQKFDDKIQIFLVNTRETKEEIKKRFRSNSRDIKEGKYRLPNLPSIVDVDAMRLNKVFPHRFVPFHVWIDKDNIIKVLGPAENTYAGKISDLIEGKDIFNLQDLSTTPFYNKYYPYYKILGKVIDPSKNNSFITPYNNEYSSYLGKVTDTITDIEQHTIRSTYVNISVLELYMSVFDKSLKKNYAGMIFQNNLGKWPFVSLYVNDTSKYTDDYKPAIYRTDKVYIRSRYCYEQVVPEALKEEERKAFMLARLNDYFGNLYGVQGKLERRTIPCYVIVRTSNQDKLRSNEKTTSVEKIFINGKEMQQIKKSPLGDAIKTVLYLKENPLLLIDGTGYGNKVDMNLPAEIRSIEELRMALKMYDLNVIREDRQFDFLVFREKNYDGPK